MQQPIQKEQVPVQQHIVSSTQPTVNAKANSLISLLPAGTIQQLIQAKLNAAGEGNIPIRFVLPQSTVMQQNSQLAQLLQAVATQQTAVPQTTFQTTVDPNVATSHTVQ